MQVYVFTELWLCLNSSVQVSNILCLGVTSCWRCFVLFVLCACGLTMIIISTNMIAHNKGKVRAQGCSPLLEGHVPFAWKKENTLWPYPSLALNTTLIWKEHAERTLWMEGLHYLKLVLHSKYFCKGHFSSAGEEVTVS